MSVFNVIGGIANALTGGLLGHATNAVNNAVNGPQGGGNEQLTQAFDHAMKQAQETLATTTIKGASLYALKQRPQ